MKNKIYNFLDNGNLILVYIISYITISILTSSSVYGLSYLVNDDVSKLFIQDYIYLKFGFIFGFIFSLLFVLMVYNQRKKQKFWRYSEQVQDLIDNAKTKKDFENIYTNNYPELINLAVGGQHITEVKRIKTIL